MIHDEEQLALVRRQLGHLEAAYQDLEQQVRPKSEKQFQLMAEMYLDEIAKLRREIDGYGAAEGRPKPARAAMASPRPKRRPA